MVKIDSKKNEIVFEGTKSKLFEEMATGMAAFVVNFADTSTKLGTEAFYELVETLAKIAAYLSDEYDIDIEEFLEEKIAKTKEKENSDWYEDLDDESKKKLLEFLHDLDEEQTINLIELLAKIHDNYDDEDEEEDD